LTHDPKYDYEHQQVRKALLASYDPSDPCARCGKPLGADPSKIDAGHRDDGLGWQLECQRCNRAAGARHGNLLRRLQRSSPMDHLAWVVLAVEVSDNYKHTSIAAAGRLDDAVIQVELADYLPGVSGAVDRLLELHARWTVRATVIDPMSNATTLIRPLEERPAKRAGVRLVKPTAADVKVAHGNFVIRGQARTIRHVKRRELDLALQHLAERRLGNAPVFDRRGALVDVAPAIASELACWGVESIRPVPPVRVF
jgi:hypothetical protein